MTWINDWIAHNPVDVIAYPFKIPTQQHHIIQEYIQTAYPDNAHGILNILVIGETIWKKYLLIEIPIILYVIWCCVICYKNSWYRIM